MTSVAPLLRRPVVLLRCSTKDQDTEFHAQRADVQKYLDAHGLVVAPEDWREEVDVHGDADERPVLDKIREEAAAGTVSHVIAADFDRLGRAGEETLWIVRQLVDDCEVEIVIARHPTVDLRTLQGRLMLFALAMAGLCKLDTVRQSTKAAFTKVDGVTVARKSGKRTGSPAFLWSPALDAEIKALRKAGRSAQEIAESIMVPRRRLVDEDGCLPAASGKPGVRFVEMMEAPGKRTVQGRLRELRAKRG